MDVIKKISACFSPDMKDRKNYEIYNSICEGENPSLEEVKKAIFFIDELKQTDSYFLETTRVPAGTR